MFAVLGSGQHTFQRMGTKFPTELKYKSDFRDVQIPVSFSISIVERFRPQFFTNFQQILHAAQKCGRFDAYYLWDKL